MVPLLVPRNSRGHFISPICPDPNCDGRMLPEDDGWWRCDGLTHQGHHDPLYACEVRHHPQYFDITKGQPS
jgi:hypothetical protein